MIRSQAKKKKIEISFKSRFLFFGRQSGIHGLGYLFREDAPFFARLFWLTVLLACSGCLYLLLVPVAKQGPEVNYTPGTLYSTWTTVFPAVTVCETYNSKYVQRKLAKIYPDLMAPLGFDFKRYLADLIYARGVCTKTTCVPCGDVIPCDLPWRQAIEQVHQACTDILSECTFNGQEFPCCKSFHQVDSEYGPCFSFNSLQSEKSKIGTLFAVNRSTGPGLLTFRLSSEAQVSVHSIEELSTNDLDKELKFDVKPNINNRVEYFFSVEDFVTDHELLDDDIEVRRCRYKYEVPKEPFHNYSVYSYGACSLAERTEHAFHHCSCVHPVRDTSYEYLYCNFTGLHCLVNFENMESKVNPDHDLDVDDCLPSCEESEISKIHISSGWYYDQPAIGTLVKVQQTSLPSLRYQRNQFRTELDLVVSIGGMVGLFFSASILSLAEILYLILRSE